ncbi:GGDEF domain-containing protein, partial [Bacillus cereus]|uniref:GGDEF domain-containing protein n=1 Tax=Bacillus cereus TaxID=1396 RepID=UPI0020BDBDD7
VFILVEIDNFKNINDTYGHQTGDSILIQVASVMKNHIRENDVAARWGGEELAVYLPNINVSSGERIAKR